MPSTYVNDLRLEEMATGEKSGTWGTITNTNLELIASAFSYGTEDLASDADATITMSDGSADEVRSIYLKITSSASLTATRTITLAPNTVSKLWIIENATTGGQSISISQGSGANVTVPSGGNKIIVTDGAGTGAAVYDALANQDVDITSGTIDGVTIGGASTAAGSFTTVTASGRVTFGELKGTDATVVNTILDEDNMSSNSDTALATQQSIKAYVNSASWGKGSDIASASSIDIGASTGQYVDITGTATITALGTVAAGTVRTLQFDGALTLTHNATSLILPGGINITTAAGDVAVFVSEGSGNWRCVSYVRASFPTVPSAFGARSSSSQTNLNSGQDIAFGAEIFDVGGDYDNSTSTFTARYTGPHCFSTAVQLDQIDIDYTLLRLNLVTSNETFELVEISPDHIAGADFTMTLSGTQTVWMDAGDTAVVDVTFAGGAAQMDTANGATYFSGHLVGQA